MYWITYTFWGLILLHALRKPLKIADKLCNFGRWIRKSYRSKIRLDFWFPFLLALCIIAVLSITYYSASNDLISSPPAHTEADIEMNPPIFESLRVFFSVAEGDSAEFREYASFHPVVAWFAGLVSICIPLLAAATAIAFLWHRLPHHVPWFRKAWYIFSELEPNSIRMANSIHNDNPNEKNVFIFLRSKRGQQEPDQLEDLQDLTYFLYPGTETRFLSLPGRKNHIMRFFFLSENTDENFSRMKELLDNAESKNFFVWDGPKLKDGQFLQELYLLSETESAPMLIDDLRNQIWDKPQFPSTELRLLDRYRAVVYDLLRDKPLHGVGTSAEVNVMVLGFGKIGREFFRAIQSIGIQESREINITLCDRRIHKKLDIYKQQCPNTSSFATVSPEAVDAESSKFHKLITDRSFDYIVVALGEDELNIRVAFWLKRYYRKKYWAESAPQPQICVNIEDPIKHSYVDELWKKSLHVFGGLDQVFTRKVLMPESRWLAARWLQMALDQTTEIPKFWSEYQRRSSLACVAHAEYHVARVGTPYAANWLALSQKEQDSIIDSEHERWMAYVQNEGMQKAEPDWTRTYYAVLGNHVDVDGRLTPCLVPANDLGTIQQLVDSLRGPSEKLTFRQRDELVVEKADCIVQIIQTGKLPQ